MSLQQKNPFDALHDLVGDCKSFEDALVKIKSLLVMGKIDVDLNAILLTESLQMPILAMQCTQLHKIISDLESKLEDKESPESNNILKFPTHQVIN